MEIMRWFVLTAALSAVLSSSEKVFAHSVWVERDGSGPARAYFGEFGEEVREKTGGLLDKIKSPRAFSESAKESLPIKRLEDHLEIAAQKPGDVRLIENGLAPREDKKEGGKSRSVFYAKAGRADVKARMDFELVPVESEGNTFTLTFRGAPLAKTEVALIAPSMWGKTLRTDDRGLVTLPTPWSGRYLARVYHTETVAGESGGEKFDRQRHVFSISFVQSGGIPWTPKP